ncbi:MAG: PocR ligand-binding domain-containing protein [Candidatus Promineifilaceae bacterium]
MDELLTTKQVQEYLQVDRTTIYRMLKDGRLKGIKIGQHWRFPRSSVEAMLTEFVAPPAQAQPETPMLSPDILPVHCLQPVQDVSAETVEVGAVTTDNDGQPLTEISNSCRFCNLILSTESGRQACINSWCTLAQQPDAQPRFFTCHAGFQYARARIEIDGVSSAILVAGQFFTAEPDPAAREDQIQQLAKRHGLSVEELHAADRRHNILSKSKQKKIAVWLKKLADTFAIISLERAEMLDRLQRIAALSVIGKE